MRRNAVEWLVLGVSVVAILVLVALLVVDGLGATSPADPSIAVRPSEGRAGQMGWIVPATVTNTGNVAAEAVAIEATAEVAGQMETSAVEIDFLPAGTDVEIAFAFSQQPPGDIATRLVSFRVP